VTSEPSPTDLQQAAEADLVAAAARELGVELAARTLALPGGASVDVDGVDVAQSVFVEVFLREGRLKGPQLDKVARDALKLVTLGRVFGPGATLVIAFGDGTAAGSVTGQSWLSEALRTWGVRVLVVGAAAADAPG
jgi:hypothetical protein